MQKIIIDGYNVIHADDQLKKTVAGDLEKARNLLIERIKVYLQRRQLQVTLVFDGAGGLTDAEPVVPGKLQVLFSSTRQTADELILSTLSNSNNPRAYIVVTSDMTDIGRSARGMGARVLGSREFLDRMTGASGPGEAGGASREAEGQDPEVDDVDYWLRKFGEKPDKKGKNDQETD